jgi:ElaB/YqjD/DUF883 family membrane-anchored ribosome-binding protein
MNTTIKTPSQLAEEMRRTANDIIETTRTDAQNAPDVAGEKGRDLRLDKEPGFEQFAARVQQAVQRGLDAASGTSAAAQRHLEQAADVTEKYIADQPVRSVLLAAAAGAAITALTVLAARHRDDY